MATKKAETAVEIPPIRIQSLRVEIIGKTPIIFHRWPEKAKEQIRAKQAKKAVSGREARDPVAEYTETWYRNLKGEIAFPANSIKQALVGAARGTNVPMTIIRGMVFVKGDEQKMIPIFIEKEGKLQTVVPTKDTEDPKRMVITEFDPEMRQTMEGYWGYDPNYPEHVFMREDMVRVGMGAADIRYRGQLSNWKMFLDVEYDSDVVSASQVVNLINRAGFSCGLGEWRPEKNGDYGTFEVAH